MINLVDLLYYLTMSTTCITVFIKLLMLVNKKKNVQMFIVCSCYFTHVNKYNF